MGRVLRRSPPQPRLLDELEEVGVAAFPRRLPSGLVAAVGDALAAGVPPPAALVEQLRRHLDVHLPGVRVAGIDLDELRPGDPGTRPRPAAPPAGERRTRSLVAWIALDQIGDDAGQLRVLPRSHLVGAHLPTTHRGTSWLRHRAVVEPRLVHLSHRPGDATILDAATVLCRHPNHADMPTRAAAVRLELGADGGGGSGVAPVPWPALLEPEAESVREVLDGAGGRGDRRHGAERAHGVDDPSPRDVQEDGYTTIRALDDPTVQRVKELIADLELAEDHGFYVSVVADSGERARSIDRALKDLLASTLSELFPDHEPLMVSVTSKGRAGGQPVLFHHDVTYIDERRTRPLFLWCPLVDSSRDSGGLEVVPGSHRWVTGIRPGRELGDVVVTEPFQEVFRRLAVEVPLWAGDALAFDPALLHGSGPNPSDRWRPAITIALVPTGSTLVHFHEARDRTLTGYLVDEAFFTMHPYGQRPEGYDTIEPWDAPVTEESYERALARLGLWPADSDRTDTDQRS